MAPGVVTAGRSGEPPRGRWLTAARACDVAASLMIVVALAAALRTTSGLTLPYDPDHFRDIAFAQTAVDGHPLADASYAGEWIWYNPLVPWLVAAGSAITGASPALVHVLSAPFLNLLGPIGFYLLGIRLAGRPAAVAGLGLYLFFVCHENCWACPTYSPWLFASTFAQGLFFLSVLALVHAAGRRTAAAAVAAGALAGLTFLAHTAPALLLALIALTLLRPAQLAACGAAALLVASPYIWAIAVHYHLHVVNTAPMRWDYAPLLPRALPGTLLSHAGWFALAAVGLIWLRARVVLVWLGGAIAMLAWSFTPFAVVPTFHFWIYLLAAVTLLAGVAMASLLRRPALVIGVVAVAVVWHLPAYWARQDFTLVRQVATSWNPAFAEMTASLRRLSTADEVVLGTYGAANLIVGPAGRKVVAPHPFMANPYVPVETRAADRDRMLEAVQAHDAAAFRPLAERYDVRLVVSVGTAECEAATTFGLLVPVERHGDVCLARVRGGP